MAQDNAALLQTALDNLVLEYKQHTADRVLGKERVTYTLNGRNLNWTEYRKAVVQEIKDLTQVLNGFDIAYIETRVR